MAYYEIRHSVTGDVLYEGPFPSFGACLERAVTENAVLNGADLRFHNLCALSLDGGRLDGARFDYANLTGTNMTEAQLTNTSYAQASLQGACLCESDLSGADFTGAIFGGTDIAGSYMTRCRFSTHSALTLPFIYSETVTECRYKDADGIDAVFSRPPLYLQGLAFPLAVIGDHILIQHTLKPASVWLAYLDDIRKDDVIDGRLYSFLRQHETLIRALAPACALSKANFRSAGRK